LTRDEAMKLLGGYATNSLTEEDRKALLAAALDDQELFDALEREQALKDVLDDRVARAEIRQALETPSVEITRWWTRWWAWGGASAAVAALALVAVYWGSQPKTAVEVSQLAKPSEPPMTAPGNQPQTPVQPALAARANQPQLPVRPPVIAPADKPQPPELKAEAPAPVRSQPMVKARQQPPALAKDTLEKKDSVSLVRSEAAAPQAPAPPATANGLARGALSGPNAMQSQAQMEAIPRDRSAFAAKKAATSSLNYTLLRRESDGREVPVLAADVRESDAIRVTVRPALAGTLSVYLERNGVSSLVTPLLTVNAQRSYTVPGVPVTVKSGDVLRLELSDTSVSIALGKP